MWIEQTLDVYGNLTQIKVFDWGNSSTARRVYTNTYLATSGYVSAYIRNRLLTTTYSENGGSAETMVSHEYDNYAAGCASGVGSCAITATSGARQKDSAFGTGYTVRGNITSSFVYGSGSWLSGNPTSWAWRLYDDTGNVVKTKSPQGIVGTAVEDSGKNFAVPQSITVAGLSSTMNWNNALGLTSASGPNGVSSGTVYDSYARPASKTSPTGAVTTFTYSGNVTTATTNGRWVKTTVDGFGRPRLTESGYSGTTVSVVESEYEPCACTPIGKLKRTTRPYAPGGTKYWTTYNYDALGRTVSVVAPDGASTTSYVYEGNTVKTTDAAGKWKKFTQDAVGNLTQVNEPNPAGGADYVTTYTYSKWDQLTGVSMPRPTGTQTRTFNYSGSNLQSKTEPETGTTSYYYKSDGRLDYTIDAKSQRTEYKYEDDLLVTPPNRRLMQVRKVIGGSEDLCQRVELLYDDYLPDSQFDAGVSSNGSGRLTAKRYKGASCTLVGGHTYVEQYSYTTYGAQTLKRLKVIRNVSGGGTASGLLVSTAEYDGEGRLLAVTYPVTGKRYQYGFDSRGLPSTLTNTTDSVTVCRA